ncbi:hypothetical protein BDB00DRAFT_877626 [Zychaea mexicana]|uniref:uncharacterized protein n=1 Tax=Zychaea mexicana TaxID=64656 RepID=UPI0022FF3B8A|nr:uncharacterized protein BDB00DRAFT_877626 [Zychaea mexicana]KAI9488239.1 hypothetical protein BDB00DRAFT_877626 [Zychaea mexicana]
MFLVTARAVTTTQREQATEYLEALAFKLNGSLPSGMEQRGGMALSTTRFPSPVKDALDGLLGTSVCEASHAEIDDPIFYTKLSTAAYCRTVILWAYLNVSIVTIA